MDGITDSLDMSLGRLQETVEDRRACCAQSMGSQRVGRGLATEQQQHSAINWIEGARCEQATS